MQVQGMAWGTLGTEAGSTETLLLPGQKEVHGLQTD